MPIGFFAEGLPVPEVEGWTPVGTSRMEWGVGNTSTDFDLLLLEQVLIDNEIPCQFFPHRPNEGFSMGRVVPLGVWLYVPDEFAQAAEALADELAAAPLADEDAEAFSGADDEGGEGSLDDDADNDVVGEENAS